MIIYKATNIINGKCYIGQTKYSLNERKSGHLCESRNDKKKKCPFHRAIRKYGQINFTWEVICECETVEEMNEMEFHYIKQYHSHGTEYGYNASWGGEFVYVSYGDDNPSRRPEVREKIREKCIGEKNAFYGKTHSDEYKKRVGDMVRGNKNPLHGDSSSRKKADKSRLKKYYLVSPEGVEMTVIDMPRFCKDNNLSKGNMYATVNGKQSHHKGWKKSP